MESGDDMVDHCRRTTDLPEHRRAKRNPKLIASGTALLLAGALVVSGLALVQTSSNTQRTCSAALGVRDAVIRVFEDAQKRSDSNPAETATERERKQNRDFFARSIATLRAADCER